MSRLDGKGLSSAERVSAWTAAQATANAEKSRIAQERDRRRHIQEPARGEPVKYDPTWGPPRFSDVRAAVMPENEAATVDDVGRTSAVVGRPRARKTSSLSAQVGLRVAVRLIPAEARPRYDEEYQAEMLSLPRHRQLLYALSLVRGTYSIRCALLESSTGGGSHPGE